jgi:hypothetical protein
LFSCQIIDKKVPTEQELFEKQIKEINWSEVDEYPSFLECDKISDNNQRKQCFFEFMATTIQQKLSVEDLTVLYPELDTIEVKVTVFPDASLQFEPQFESDSLAYDKIKIDSILKTKLIDFPKVNPALKRGIPVKTEFILPVIIKSN